MSKFKVGDRVKHHLDGHQGHIAMFDGSRYAVRWDGEDWSGSRCLWEPRELYPVETDKAETLVLVSSAQITQDTLTIRDKFAMAALTGMIASEGNLVDEGCAFYTPSNAAERAYIFADAMLEARKVKS